MYVIKLTSKIVFFLIVFYFFALLVMPYGLARYQYSDNFCWFAPTKGSQNGKVEILNYTYYWANPLRDFNFGSWTHFFNPFFEPSEKLVGFGHQEKPPHFGLIVPTEHKSNVWVARQGSIYGWSYSRLSFWKIPLSEEAKWVSRNYESLAYTCRTIIRGRNAR